LSSLYTMIYGTATPWEGLEVLKSDGGGGSGNDELVVESYGDGGWMLKEWETMLGLGFLKLMNKIWNVTYDTFDLTNKDKWKTLDS
jgi:hypothetical protein